MRMETSIPVLVLIAMTATFCTDAVAANDGFIYGKITTRSGETYTGTMRWGKQECFWDDLFNATKKDNPWKKYASEDIYRDAYESKDNKYKLKVLGITVYNSIGFSGNHMFISRFGDIQCIKNKRRRYSTIVMKNGTEYDVSGYGDVGEKIQMLDENLGKIKISWDEIKEIEFMPTSKNAKVPGYRLQGKLKTDEMEFEGYIMWDAEECLSSDILDGETDDGDMEIEFGNIRSIKRMSSRGCRVTLKDGRKFELRGTNDVNDENRGIYVWDDRYGKIEVQWDEFDEVIYEEKDDSGKPYDAYKPAQKLHGSVETIDNDVYQGEIVFDFDESEDFEILNGMLDEMEFNIPFSMIASITPRGRHSSTVELVNGLKLRLEDAQDVSAKNDGILVFQDKKKPKYVAWEDVEKITFK